MKVAQLLGLWGPWQHQVCRDTDCLRHKSYGPQFSSVQLLSRVRLFVTPWTAAHQASLSFTVSWSLLKLESTELVTPSNHLILCRPLLLLPPIFPSIRVFPKELALLIRWPKYWNFSFSNSLSPLRGDTIIPTSQMWKRRGRERN